MSDPDYALVRQLVRLSSAEDRGALAALRRGLGKVPGTAPSMFPYVAPYVPSEDADHDGAYYLAAALFSMHPMHTDRPVSVGDALRRIPGRAAGEQTSSQELRFRALLKADAEALPHRLRHAVALLRSHDIPLNYHLLLRHLLHWEHPRRWVQKRWAVNFWASPELPLELSATTSSTNTAL